LWFQRIGDICSSKIIITLPTLPTTDPGPHSDVLPESLHACLTANLPALATSQQNVCAVRLTCMHVSGYVLRYKGLLHIPSRRNMTV
jgi:hypothetical protein